MKLKRSVSDLRKRYIARLVGRCLVFVASIVMLLVAPEKFDILYGMNFFDKLSIFHVMWAIWIVDMLLQLVPIPAKIALGSQKMFQKRFQPIRKKIKKEALKAYIITTTKAAYKVMALWIALIAVIGVLYFTGVIDRKILFICTTCFYVCDLICVLIWCPFRLMMKNKCCTTCRIFNWDHLMMFSPIIFVDSFYTWSLAAMAIIAWLVWELCVMIFPERFWEFSNEALQCANCTDKLCTQYCQKLRKKKE